MLSTENGKNEVTKDSIAFYGFQNIILKAKFLKILLENGSET